LRGRAANEAKPEPRSFHHLQMVASLRAHDLGTDPGVIDDVSTISRWWLH